MQIQSTNTICRDYQIFKIAYSIYGSLKRNTITFSSGGDIDENLTWFFVWNRYSPLNLAWIIHEDSASRGNLAKQLCQSSEKRGSPRAEEDGPRCDAKFSSGVE